MEDKNIFSKLTLQTKKKKKKNKKKKKKKKKIQTCLQGLLP